MTCASHVQAQGQGFPGQLGLLFAMRTSNGLTRLAAGIKDAGSLAFVQLHHAGMRSPRGVDRHAAGRPVRRCRNDARALTTAEVEQLAEDFIAAAVRADKAGFDGVEAARCTRLHPLPVPEPRDQSTHGSLRRLARESRPPGVRDPARDPRALPAGPHARHRACHLSASVSSSAKCASSRSVCCTKARSIFSTCRSGMLQGAERSGALQVRCRLVYGPRARQRPHRCGRQDHDRSDERRRAASMARDFAIIGRGAVLHHDFPLQVRANPDFEAIDVAGHDASTCAPKDSARRSIDYMRTWTGFVAASSSTRSMQSVADRAGQAVGVDVARIAEALDALQLPCDRTQVARHDGAEHVLPRQQRRQDARRAPSGCAGRAPRRCPSRHRNTRRRSPCRAWRASRPGRSRPGSRRAGRRVRAAWHRAPDQTRPCAMASIAATSCLRDFATLADEALVFELDALLQHVLGRVVHRRDPDGTRRTSAVVPTPSVCTPSALERAMERREHREDADRTGRASRGSRRCGRRPWRCNSRPRRRACSSRRRRASSPPSVRRLRGG